MYLWNLLLDLQTLLLSFIISFIADYKLQGVPKKTKNHWNNVLLKFERIYSDNHVSVMKIISGL
jgi:hypothetical protein